MKVLLTAMEEFVTADDKTAAATQIENRLTPLGVKGLNLKSLYRKAANVKSTAGEARSMGAHCASSKRLDWATIKVYRSLAYPGSRQSTQNSTRLPRAARSNQQRRDDPRARNLARYLDA